MGNAVSFFGASYEDDMYILFDAENCVNENCSKESHGFNRGRNCHSLFFLYRFYLLNTI